MKQLQQLRRELDGATLGFILGCALIVYGVSRVTVPGALILAGLILCATCILLKLSAQKAARERQGRA